MNPDGDENQNNLNGVPNADPAQQVVFTPEPTTVTNQEDSSSPVQQAVFTPEPAPQPTVIESQDRPAITGTVVEPAQTGLSHPYLSNHPTQSFASGVGDIVIKEKRPRKIVNKKIFIVIGVVLAVVLIIVGIVISSLIRNNAAKAFESNFKSYASFLLYEDPEDDTWTETDQSDNYVTMPDYALYQYFYGTNRVEYFDSLTVFFNNFTSKYRTARKKLNTTEINFIDRYIEEYQVLDTLSRAPAVDPVSMQTLLADVGADSVMSWVENNFTSLKSTESGREYFDIMKDYTEAIISGENDSSAWEKANSLYNKLVLTQSYLVNSLQQGCWEIWGIIMEQNNA